MFGLGKRTNIAEHYISICESPTFQINNATDLAPDATSVVVGRWRDD